MIVFQNKKLLDDVDFLGLSNWLKQVVIQEKKIIVSKGSLVKAEVA